MTEATLKTYQVQGMSCAHCRSSVLEEIEEIEGVEHAEVDVASGRLEIQGPGIDDEQVRAAVEEAGYSLAGGEA
jgi:copper chaperone CopZ